MARDQAILRATLNVGSVNETVEVTAAAPVVATEAAVFDTLRARSVAGMALAAPMAQRAYALATPKSAPATQTETHTRSYFPEALFIAPETITDSHGNATASFPVADSITTWRMSMFASTRTGALGSASSSLKVFEDFFVDLDLPITITRGDRISIPVAIYNYTDKAGNVQLQLQPEGWFDLPDNDANKNVNAPANTVGSSSFTIQAKHIGKFKLTLAAHMGNRQDTVVREIDVVPDGQPREIVFNGRLDGSAQPATEQTVSFPPNSLPESTNLFVRLAENDMVSATATIHNNLDKQANMVMVDLGIPPGFELQTEDLQTMVENTTHARSGRLEKFNLTATQAILYFNGIGAGQTIKVHFRLRAKYPIRAKAFASRVYEYYDPAVTATARPATFEVVAH